MTTFDLTEVRGFAADLTARMDQCDNGEGMECATLDATLRHYADLCCQFCEGMRRWGREVFAGRVAFNPEVEGVWRAAGERLFNRAAEMLLYGHEAEDSGPCYVLDGTAVLSAAFLDFGELLGGWVSPKLAVGVSARHEPLAPAEVEEGRRRLAALPPLPADWQPEDVRQRQVLRKLRTR